MVASTDHLILSFNYLRFDIRITVQIFFLIMKRHHDFFSLFSKKTTDALTAFLSKSNTIEMKICHNLIVPENNVFVFTVKIK